MTSDRPTVELGEGFVPGTSRREDSTQYSVSKRRATTEDERQVLVERAGPPAPPARPTPVPPSPRKSAPLPAVAAPRAAPAWRVEIAHDRLWVRSDAQSIELDLEEARTVAELILRATGK